MKGPTVCFVIILKPSDLPTFLPINQNLNFGPWYGLSPNKVNGAWVAESHDLLTDVLRDDWDFQGLGR